MIVFTNLQSLHIDCAEINDYSFQGLTSLKHLELFCCLFDNFKSESFNLVPKLQFLSIHKPENLNHFNVNELTMLRWLKVSYFTDYDFLETLDWNKHLNVLVFEDFDLNMYQLTGLSHSYLETLELEFHRLDNFSDSCLENLPSLRNLSFVNNQVDLVTMQINFKELSSLESIFFEKINFSSLNLSKLANLN